MTRVLVLNTGSSSVKWTMLAADKTVIADGSEAWAAEDSAARADQLRAALERAPTFDAAGHREPVLKPLLPQERLGAVSNVGFPTGIDRRLDLGLPDRIDVYYGMADNRIGAARLDVPDRVPAGVPADSQGRADERVEGSS